MKPKSHFCFLLIILTMMCSGQSFGQDSKQELRFKHFGANEGLSQISALSLFQDEESKLWIGTRYGLNLYDGYSFDTFTNEPWDTTSLVNNQINAIVGDSTTHSIWLGTNAGICRYDRETDYFQRYTLVNGQPFEGNITSLVLDDQQTLWITTTKGLFYLNLVDQKIRVAISQKTQDVNDTFFISSLRDHLGNIWFAGRLGVFKHDINDSAGQISAVPIVHGQDTLQTGLSLFEDEDKLLWVGSHKYLWQYNPTNELVNKYQNVIESDHSLRFDAKKMTRGLEDSNLWVTTYLGVMIFDKEERKYIDRIYHDPVNKYSLVDHSIHSILIANNEDRWIGTYSGGLHQYSTLHNYFDLEQQNPSEPNSLNSNIINGFTEGPDGKLYIASSRGGLNVYDPKSKTYTSHLQNINMRHLLFDKDENLWIGTFFDGLIRFDIDSFQAYHNKYQSDKKNNLKNRHTRHSSFMHSNGTIWVAMHHFLYLHDKTNDEFEEFELPVEAPNGNIEIASILEIDENLWLFTTNGIHVFDPASKSFIDHYQYDPEDEHQLPSNRLTSAIVDQNGVLWIASFAGVSKFNKENETFTNYATKDGLASNMNLCLLVDKFNHVWVSSSNGLTKLNQKTGVFTSYDERNNLQNKAFRKGACYSCSNGDLLFGGIMGFNRIKPTNEDSREEVLKVRLNDLYLFDEKLTPSPNTVLPKKINFLKEVTLSYTDKVFSIEYGAVNLSGNKELEYACFLEGFDNDWHSVGTKTIATYTNLSPGRYSFHVKIDNPQSLNKAPITTLEIIIIPPFWQTDWFKILLMIGALLSIFIIHRWRVSKLLRQRKKLDDRVKQRTLTIAEKNQELAVKNQNLVDAEEEVRAALEQVTSINESLEQKVQERTNRLKQKNHQLKEYAFLNSHKVRAPLVRILGLVNLFQNQLVDTEEVDFLHDEIKKSALELDEITRKINNELGDDIDGSD